MLRYTHHQRQAVSDKRIGLTLSPYPLTLNPAVTQGAA